MIYTVSLRKNFEFRYVYNKGRSLANKHIIMYTIKNGLDINRLGISVSKKIGNSVTRNHVKRRLKESYRTSELEIKKGYDIVLIARAGIDSITFNDTAGSLRHLLKLHGLLW